MNKQVQKAIALLNAGGVILFPTDTVPGIGCRIDKAGAIKRIFSIKKRQLSQAVPVLVSGIPMAQEYLQPISTKVTQLMEKYWPGGLTVIYPCIVEKVHPLIRGDAWTLGVRSPNHQVTQELLRGIEVPLIGTSANFHGHPSPASISDVDGAFAKLADFVLPGESKNHLASTILDCSHTPWKIVRQGAVALSDLS